MGKNLYLIDTSSLLNLVRYYLPFDDQNKLYGFVENQFKAKNFIMLTAIYEECKGVSNGLVLEKLKFLKDKDIKKLQNKTATQKLHNLLDNNWHVPEQKNKLDNHEFTTKKQKFLKSGDCQLIFHAINIRIENKNKSIKNEVIIVTEESSSSNDNKLFKKIPLICKQEEIKCRSLPQLLEDLEVGIDFTIPKK